MDTTFSSQNTVFIHQGHYPIWAQSTVSQKQFLSFFRQGFSVALVVLETVYKPGCP